MRDNQIQHRETTIKVQNWSDAVLCDDRAKGCWCRIPGVTPVGQRVHQEEIICRRHSTPVENHREADSRQTRQVSDPFAASLGRSVFHVPSTTLHYRPRYPACCLLTSKNNKLFASCAVSLLCPLVFCLSVSPRFYLPSSTRPVIFCIPVSQPCPPRVCLSRWDLVFRNCLWTAVNIVVSTQTVY